MGAYEALLSHLNNSKKGDQLPVITSLESTDKIIVFDESTGLMSAIIKSNVIVNGSLTSRISYTAIGDEGQINLVPFPNNIDLYKNGQWLIEGTDYTYDNTTGIIALTIVCVAGDYYEIRKYTSASGVTEIEGQQGIQGIQGDPAQLGFSVVATLVDLDALITAGTGGNWIITNNITLDGNKVLPSGVTLHFNGGVISGGGFTLTGNDTKMEANLVQCFDTNIVFSGIWYVFNAFPEWFGAVADGFTDDSIAIQTALDFTRGGVELSAKTYVCNDIYVAGGKTLNGKGDNSNTKLLATSNGVRGVVYADQPRAVISNLTIDGGRASAFNNIGFSTSSVPFSSSNFDIRLEKVSISECQGNCIYALGANHLTITNCTIENSDVELAYLDACYVTNILESEFQFDGTIGIKILNGSSIGTAVIQGCWFEALNGNAIEVSHYNVNISHNKFLNPSLTVGKANIRLLNGAASCVIESNTFQSYGSGVNIILEAGVINNSIINNIGISYTGAPLATAQITDNGSAATYIEALVSPYGKYTRSNGVCLYNGGIIRVDESTNEVSLNNVYVDVVGADRRINNVGSGRLILRSASNENSYRARQHTFTKENGVSGSWSDGYMLFCGHYLWVDSTGVLRIKSSVPTSDIDGTVVGTQI